MVVISNVLKRTQSNRFKDRICNSLVISVVAYFIGAYLPTSSYAGNEVARETVQCDWSLLGVSCSVENDVYRDIEAISAPINITTSPNSFPLLHMEHWSGNPVCDNNLSQIKLNTYVSTFGLQIMTQDLCTQKVDFGFQVAEFEMLKTDNGKGRESDNLVSINDTNMSFNYGPITETSRTRNWALTNDHFVMNLKSGSGFSAEYIPEQQCNTASVGDSDQPRLIGPVSMLVDDRPHV